jgi:hypothetical protein
VQVSIGVPPMLHCDLQHIAHDHSLLQGVVRVERTSVLW